MVEAVATAADSDDVPTLPSAPECVGNGPARPAERLEPLGCDVGDELGDGRLAASFDQPDGEVVAEISVEELHAPTLARGV